jgi:hypothetical protein
MAQRKKKDMKITTVKVSDLLPYANNAREHTEAQVAQIAASIQEFGWTNPLIVHGSTVVAGHARLAAARKLGLEEVPVIDRSDMSDAQWKAYVLADNQLAQNATWNEGLLTLELDALQELDFDLDLIGFGEELGDYLDAESWGDALGGLPEGDSDGFQQMTFVLTDEQVETVKRAIAAAGAIGAYNGTGNENANGNAIARLAETFLTDHE